MALAQQKTRTHTQMNTSLILFWEYRFYVRKYDEFHHSRRCESAIRDAVNTGRMYHQYNSGSNRHLYYGMGDEGSCTGDDHRTDCHRITGNVLWKAFQVCEAKKDSFQLRLSLLKELVPLGISSFLTQISIVVIMGVMNNVLVIFGAQSKYGADIPLTVVGIVMKVFQIVISFVVGIAAGAQPIVGYNYGAREMKRVKKLFKIMMLAELVVGLIAMVCFEFFPLQIIHIFGSENSLYNEFAVLAFRLYLGTIVLCCMQKAMSIFLQSLGKPTLSIGLSLLRDFVLSVPFILLLPTIFGVKGALYSAPLADCISFVFVILVTMYILRHLNTEQEAVHGKRKLKEAS